MTNLTLGTSAIRESDGLYSLNDLHEAAGGEDKHRPNYFLGNAQTQALVEEIETAGNPAVKTKEGRNGGTYACRELVIAYAAWISAAFHLKVIRVFLAQTSPTVTSPKTKGGTVTLRNRRFIVEFDHDGREIVKPLPVGGYAVDVNDRASLNTFIRENVPVENIPTVISAATERLIIAYQFSKRNPS